MEAAGGHEQGDVVAVESGDEWQVGGVCELHRIEAARAEMRGDEVVVAAFELVLAEWAVEEDSIEVLFDGSDEGVVEFEDAIVGEAVGVHSVDGVDVGDVAFVVRDFVVDESLGIGAEVRRK